MTLLEQLRLTESAAYDNFEVNYAINKLASIQESSVKIDTPLAYTPEMVPVIRLECGGSSDDMYCVDCDNFKKLIRSNDMTVTSAIDAMMKQVSSDTGTDITQCEMGIVFKEEDTSSLYEAVTKDLTKINPRYNALCEHVKLIEDIQATGAKVIFV
jgi:hypothetical protein